MHYLLDSDSISDLYEPSAPNHPRIASHMAALGRSDRVFISILAIYEAEYGCANAPDSLKPILRQRIVEMQADFEVLPLTLKAAHLFGRLKVGLVKIRTLSKKAAKFHSVDLMLAATALEHNCVLVSADSIYGDLSKANTALQVEDWLG
jgi:predicted nucleic acid-binding protein